MVMVKPPHGRCVVLNQNTPGMDDRQQLLARTTALEAENAEVDVYSAR
jgi:hypothetical protein